MGAVGHWFARSLGWHLGTVFADAFGMFVLVIVGAVLALYVVHRVRRMWRRIGGGR